MASRVQKIMFWDTFKDAKSVILHFFPVAEIGRNIHLLYFSYLQEIYSQFVEWEKNVLSPYSPQWSVHFSVSLLLITRKHPVEVVMREEDSLLLAVVGVVCKSDWLLQRVRWWPRCLPRSWEKWLTVFPPHSHFLCTTQLAWTLW